ncbi:hypothetical protein GE09DRAFT_742244 [Coniochaeta sp. 2T2.1]|nr:hypothetical protein GE09DRAFT_742244 [Coniochaeta sp. 2T2.1]
MHGANLAFCIPVFSTPPAPGACLSRVVFLLLQGALYPLHHRQSLHQHQASRCFSEREAKRKRKIFVLEHTKTQLKFLFCFSAYIPPFHRFAAVSLASPAFVPSASPLIHTGSLLDDLGTSLAGIWTSSGLLSATGWKAGEARIDYLAVCQGSTRDQSVPAFALHALLTALL